MAPNPPRVYSGTYPDLVKMLKMPLQKQPTTPKARRAQFMESLLSAVYYSDLSHTLKWAKTDYQKHRVQDQDVKTSRIVIDGERVHFHRALFMCLSGRYLTPTDRVFYVENQPLRMRLITSDMYRRACTERAQRAVLAGVTVNSIPLVFREWIDVHNKLVRSSSRKPDDSADTARASDGSRSITRRRVRDIRPPTGSPRGRR